MVHNNTDPGTISISVNPKRHNIEDDVESSGFGTWESREKPRKKRKYINAYLSGYYGKTDFGDMGRQDTHWKVNEIDVTKALCQFRQASVEGAQQRKFLSNNRVLPLSFTFLFSPTYKQLRLIQVAT